MNRYFFYLFIIVMFIHVSVLDFFHENSVRRYSSTLQVVAIFFISKNDSIEYYKYTFKAFGIDII